MGSHWSLDCDIGTPNYFVYIQVNNLFRLRDCLTIINSDPIFLQEFNVFLVY